MCVWGGVWVGVFMGKEVAGNGGHDEELFGGRERVVADRGEIEKDVCGVGHVWVRYPLPKPASASLLLSAPLSLFLCTACLSATIVACRCRTIFVCTYVHHVLR